jgi:MFS family permease
MEDIALDRPAPIPIPISIPVMDSSPWKKYTDSSDNFEESMHNNIDMHDDALGISQSACACASTPNKSGGNGQGSLSYSYSYATGTSNSISDDEFDEIVIPSPQPNILSRQSRQSRQSEEFMASDTTPLVASKRLTKTARESSRNIFGNNHFDSHHGRDTSTTFAVSSTEDSNAKQKMDRGITGFFFGFMYEEQQPDDARADHREPVEDVPSALKLVLYCSFMLTTAAATVPVTLVPILAQSLLTQNTSLLSMSSFTSRAAASSVTGLALGKFINGPLGDILGARRVSIAYAAFLSVALLFLSMCGSEWSSLWACFFVEFFQSVQWQGIIVILASHTRGHRLEAGIYAASLSSRLGSLLSIPLTSLLLRTFHWRTVAVLAALGALLGAFILLLATDSPRKVNDPQNPISPLVLQRFHSRMKENPPIHKALLVALKTVTAVLSDNVVPAILAVLRSMSFWIVAVAHAGDAIIFTSTRVLGMYYYDTSGGTLNESTASSLAVVLSLGTIFGLAIAGNIFTGTGNPRERKLLLGKLYLASICACYTLAALAIPTVQLIIGEAGLILAFQLISTFFMGFGGAVPSYIPGIVGASFGKNKGLFLAYSDGIAYGLSSLVWKVVGEAVYGGSGGWAYGWAAVALLVVICALVMLEFFENYFVRRCQESPRSEHGGGYETIFFV